MKSCKIYFLKDSIIYIIQGFYDSVSGLKRVFSAALFQSSLNQYLRYFCDTYNLKTYKVAGFSKWYQIVQNVSFNHFDIQCFNAKSSWQERVIKVDSSANHTSIEQGISKICIMEKIFAGRFLKLILHLIRSLSPFMFTYRSNYFDFQDSFKSTAVEI